MKASICLQNRCEVPIVAIEMSLLRLLLRCRSYGAGEWECGVVAIVMSPLWGLLDADVKYCY